MKMLKELNNAIKEHVALTQSLVNTTEMIRGSYSEIYSKCGNKNCRCFNGEKHLCLRINWTENSKSTTKSISREQANWAKENTLRYKKFRKARKQLVDIALKTKDLLDKLEEDIVNDTWKRNKEVTQPE
jgi:hypothetical protein